MYLIWHLYVLISLTTYQRLNVSIQFLLSTLATLTHVVRLEAKMRAEGRIISRDFMSPEDKEWLEMDIEDSFQLADGEYEIPFYESDEWVKHFGEKP